MTFQGSITDLQTAEVLDSTGEKVGKVGQVYLTKDSQDPSWVTVNIGLFGSRETFIPLAEAKYAEGAITVPYEKSFIKDAPNIDEDGEISRQEESELYRYYGVSDPDAASGDGQDREADAQGRGTAQDRTGTAQQDPAVQGQQAPVADGQAGAGAGAGVSAAGAGVGAAGLAGRGTGADAQTGDGALEDEQRRAAQDGVMASGEAGTAAGADAPGAPGAADDQADVDGKQSVTLHEERLNVGTEKVETGRVRLRKYTVSETQQVEVPVEREEVVVERVPAGEETGGEIADGETEAEVPLTEERPVVNKETVATEQVNIGTRTVQDTETVSGEVGREEVDITDADGRPVEGDGEGERA
ncbi:PRC and DUF2382 domain-containing protein [Brachybacterium sp. MASK1Z-5]|uniref:PRC and DUF2382 domain-containing protein n=1 Tax=Brachybacterium halotolerans TaxID=2795215 RepID=A0ABS1B8V9_9MICO|nr:PRC and DUF2382 domain-containing protein [Brachybacterium halotolerans]MBK0331073.1 PRC and DUF2382 domain-containing protein [Brachybacterium halotolerans]